MKFVPGSRVRLPNGTIAEVRLVQKDGTVLLTIPATGEDAKAHKSELREV